MKRLFVCLIFLISIQFAVYSQCIDKEKIEYGGDYGNVTYMFLCPTYHFAKNGDTSHIWNVGGNNVDIKQAPKKALKYKKLVESKIKEYAGTPFYSNLEFIDVEVVYPEKFQAFIDSGRPDVKYKFCKAKYLYAYLFRPDTISGYVIGIAVNESGKIISPFAFPSKKHYKLIDKTFTYCKLVNIARKVQKDNDPIDEIKLEYNESKKRFYWLITQSLVNPREGINYINKVMIDAADLSKVKTIKFQTYVDF